MSSPTLSRVADDERISGRELISILVPAHNEQKTIRATLEAVLLLPLARIEVIVVDDGSTDDTGRIISELAGSDLRVRHYRIAARSGKTAAIARCIAAATGDICVIQDADSEYSPEQLPALLEPILSGSCDVVYGSRMRSRENLPGWSPIRRLGNHIVTAVSNLLSNWRVSDMETCYKAFRLSIVRPLRLQSKGFGVEVELTAMISRTNARFAEVPITYRPRPHLDGKKIRWRDGVWAIYYLVYFNLFVVNSAAGKQYVRNANTMLAESLLHASPG